MLFTGFARALVSKMLAGILHTASSSSSWVRCKALTPNGVLHHRKNKVGSLRRTQSELEIKLARYHGEDPATVQQDDMALPENLNMKVMCVSRSLLYPHPVLWMVFLLPFLFCAAFMGYRSAYFVGSSVRKVSQS